MYGLLLESLCHTLKGKYGDDKWEEIRRKAGVTHHAFSSHKVYSETLIPRLGRAAAEVTGESSDTIMELFGVGFVAYVGQYGYDRILRVLGRHMRDFLNGLDNLHEYLRFSYPKLKPPSFFCENETAKGLMLHYRSKRKGYLHYVCGQIKEVGRVFYHTDVTIQVVREANMGEMSHVVLNLRFDNTAFIDAQRKVITEASLPVSSEMFFDVFPFNIVFNKSMVVKNIGAGLRAILPDLVGSHLDETFSLTRPLVEFSWENVSATQTIRANTCEQHVGLVNY